MRKALNHSALKVQGGLVHIKFIGMTNVSHPDLLAEEIVYYCFCICKIGISFDNNKLLNAHWTKPFFWYIHHLIMLLGLRWIDFEHQHLKSLALKVIISTVNQFSINIKRLSFYKNSTYPAWLLYPTIISKWQVLVVMVIFDFVCHLPILHIHNLFINTSL